MPMFRPPPIAPSEITPQSVFLDRRRFMQGAAALGALGAGGGSALAAPAALAAPRNAAFSVDAEPTPKKLVTGYNNYYEFGTGKYDPAASADQMKTRPWTIEVGGEVEKPQTIDIEALLKMQLQERVYRFRCVEAWSMVVPWVGLEFNQLAKMVGPTSKAKYVKFTTAMQPETMPGLRVPVLDWPYVEGLRIDEAMHPLTLLTLGVYGEILPNQNGAPVRIIVPWKYGFKSVKSIVKIEFVEQQPGTAWNKAAANEYGFYSNVNPNVDHPRWTQKRERALPALFASRQTEIFNGYGDQVASLYAGMDLKSNF
ncbi:protein-methionine-sulfoxide reductase catalytic subunit MsrP [Alsobacter metallidurans]|uniref:Protein-methionine-sulfoxide reductase catalytic subunit MsrP n=1 Tax=Alsobacter metallidurans TaxID=340221 RepID=A0A917I3Y7_9HYPH|nr:protein-methionine-sulfoxide reductase catalytic subunit MsrP [Alsobacter metallidurans]GGH06817.1 protein-methionine-sulfoxide reductase catalytic subunit MsrP [Alsobacter metallidurans]